MGVRPKSKGSTKVNRHHPPGKSRPRERFRPDSDRVLIPGRRPVQELLRLNIRPDLLLTSVQVGTRREEPLLVECRAAGWQIEQKEKAELERLCDGLPHQSFVALLKEYPYQPFQKLLDLVEQTQAPLIVALDQIQDVGNLGAIIRTAVCAGADGILLPIHKSASINSVAIKRSAGAVFHLPIARVMNLSKGLDELIECGFTVAGADQEGHTSLFESTFAGPTVMVIGSEGRGLRPGIKRRCNQLLSIPMTGKVESLNAAAAAAVCLFELYRQKTANSVD